ncbi:hypothetical protein niasHS_007636 [Heterodera schachtii]|uniref:Uncharacterized protein n=1 Tax=Heterodera schachtii TaxID=97005 RepID=A0ABD2JP87_HETSC
MALSLFPRQNVPKMLHSPLLQQHENNNNNVRGPLGYSDQLELLAHSGRMAKKCRHDCSISDPNAEKCWNETLAFYEQTLFGVLRRVILVETNRILWMTDQNEHRHGSVGVNYERLTSDSFRRFLLLPRRQIVADKNDWKKASLVFEQISPAIMDSVGQLVNKLHHYYSNGNGKLNEPPPFLRFDCPRPCERGYSVWKWLFVGSLSLFVFQLVLIFLFVFLLDRREQKMWRTESTDFGENASVVLVKGKKQ